MYNESRRVEMRLSVSQDTTPSEPELTPSEGASMNNFQDKANFIWQVADDILRGTFKQHEYGEIILPFVVLRRLDCVLEDNKDAVIKAYQTFRDKLEEDKLEPVLLKAAGGRNFYNHSQYDLRRLAQDAGSIELNFNNYLNGYGKNVRGIIENFQIDKLVERLVKNDLLFMLIDRFTEIDLSPQLVENHEMGYIFEELLRRFSEMSNETAGEHYTPREVIRLMVNLLFAEHADDLQGKGIICSVFDPACGTGGMLTTAKEHIQTHINPAVEIRMYGQELNEQTYAIAKSDVLIMGENADNVRLGTSFSNDRFKGQRFNYMLSNPPFGVSWKKEKEFIEKEASDPHGRFSAGTPRSSDGALLFLQHMLSKMETSGSRIAIIFNGSPLFTGDAGSGESNIRKWIIENDWLEAVVAMPTDMFYNTGIATYIWIVTNRKPAARRGKVQLINAVDYFVPMRKSLGSKRRQISQEQIEQITRIYSAFEADEHCRIFDNADFGYTKVTVERPLVQDGRVVKDKQGSPKADSGLRDYEKVALKDDIETYFAREVLPHVPDAWMERARDKVGYEISFTKYFYKYTPLRPLEQIKADILALEEETKGLLGEILGL
jgi:type I restriction enzyme M protein